MKLATTAILDNKIKDHPEDSPKRRVDETVSGDEVLLQRFRRGEEDAATALYRRYAVRLKRLAEKKTDAKMASRIDPEGVVQSVFRTFFRRVSKGQYEVGDGDSLWNLLLVISLNKLKKEVTKHKTAKRDISKTFSLEDSDQRAVNSSEDEAFLILKMTIDEVLGDLGQSERKIVEMRIAGADINQIASETGRAKRSVERILQSFRKRLQGAIESG